MTGIKAIYFGDHTVKNYHGEAFQVGNSAVWIFKTVNGDNIRTNFMELSFIN